jgi:hypothetical protein
MPLVIVTARMMNAAASVVGDYSDKLLGKGVRPSAIPPRHLAEAANHVAGDAD